MAADTGDFTADGLSCADDPPGGRRMQRQETERAFLHVPAGRHFAAETALRSA